MAAIKDKTKKVIAMKIIYTSDLHGDRAKFLKVFELAKKNGVKAVINGGDMLCYGDDLHRSQKAFVKEFLDDYFADYERAGIYHLGYLGNDDLKILDTDFEKVCAKYSHTINLPQKKIELDSFEFIGMNWVVDYPFQLKDRCRKDTKDYVFQRQFGPGFLSMEKGFKELPDWFAYASTLSTIEDELETLPKPKNLNKTIYVLHMPPANLGLDVCQSGDKVGSQAIHEFIKKTQPLLTLHGHIHESFQCSGVWKANVGKTICVQPGQKSADFLSYVLIDLKRMNLERFDEPLSFH